MDVKRNTSWLVALVAAGALAAAGCGAQERADSKHPDSYSAESIEGWVVDADTNEPLEGVVVVAAWILYGWTTPYIKFDQVGTLELMESVTDKYGRYSFPAWGPLERPSKGVLTDYDPRLSFFKSGYDIEIVSNPLRSKIPTKSIRTSQWNGKTIKIKKFQGTMRQYRGRIYTFAGTTIVDAFETCEWKKIPNTVIALRRENERLEPYGVRGVGVERILPLPGEDDPCGALEFWERTTIQ